MEPRKGLVYKVAIVGESAVGKTSLIKQYVYQQFGERYLSTLGTNVYKKSLASIGPENKLVTLQIWDVLGQRVFRSIIKTVFQNTHGVIFVCDLTRRSTLNDLEHWIHYSYNYSKSPSFIFLGNKCDLPHREFWEEELKSFASIYDSPYLLTSAKTGENVEKAFEMMATAIVEGKTAPPKIEAEMRKLEHDASPVIKAEDQIITEFCEALGGFEMGMPIIREHFQAIGIDFEHPTKEQIRIVAFKLVEYLSFVKDDGTVKELEERVNKILTENKIIESGD